MGAMSMLTYLNRTITASWKTLTSETLNPMTEANVAAVKKSKIDLTNNMDESPARVSLTTPNIPVPLKQKIKIAKMSVLLLSSSSLNGTVMSAARRLISFSIPINEPII